MFKNILNSFKKKTYENDTIQPNCTQDIQELYLKKVNNLIWSDYVKLNKFEKVYAFSVKGIDDISIVDAIRHSYFNTNEPFCKVPLNKDVKNKLKELGLHPNNINNSVTINRHIYSLLGHYINSSKLPSTYHIRIVSPLLAKSEEIETMLHNIIFSTNSQELYKFIPPNHPSDHSKISFIRDKDIHKYETKSIDIGKLNSIIHKDYDFNILQFIIDDFNKL